MTILKKTIFIFGLLQLFITGCNAPEVEEKKSTTLSMPAIPTPDFDEDSAWMFVKKQVDFGPRIPNTPSHDSCAGFFEKTFSLFTNDLIIQTGTVTAYNGSKLHIKNFIAQFDKDNKQRVMLCAHWDTRPYADQDRNLPKEPFDGAADGASGVGILLEIARQLRNAPPNTGVDIILFDAEDYGSSGSNNSYCLGTQYWAQNPPVKNYYPKYAILIDMVGAKDATFAMEGYSMQFAPSVVKKVWNTAARLGYSSFFIYKQTSPLTDDHYYINTIAHIPAIDILHHDPSARSGFPSYWHTHDDNMDIIDKNTLKAVGQTLLEVIYNE